MGLCKCPKRTVTNLFCYEHLVNVCENCMIVAHPSCVIQSYLSWLQDADFNLDCQFCSKPLTSQECVRLGCYHVFHWNCLRIYFETVSSTTNTFQCTICEKSIHFNLSGKSPVANELQKKLSSTPWGHLVFDKMGEVSADEGLLNETQYPSNSACCRNKNERLFSSSLFRGSSGPYALYTIDEEPTGKYSKRRVKSSFSTKLSHFRRGLNCKLLCICLASVIVTCIIVFSTFDYAEPAGASKSEIHV